MMSATKRPVARKMGAKKPVVKKAAPKPVAKNSPASTAKMIRGLREDAEALSANADRLLDRLRNL